MARAVMSSFSSNVAAVAIRKVNFPRRTNRAQMNLLLVVESGRSITKPVTAMTSADLQYEYLPSQNAWYRALTQHFSREIAI